MFDIRGAASLCYSLPGAAQEGNENKPESCPAPPRRTLSWLSLPFPCGGRVYYRLTAARTRADGRPGLRATVGRQPGAGRHVSGARAPSTGCGPYPGTGLPNPGAGSSPNRPGHGDPPHRGRDHVPARRAGGTGIGSRRPQAVPPTGTRQTLLELRAWGHSGERAPAPVAPETGGGGPARLSEI